MTRDHILPSGEIRPWTFGESPLPDGSDGFIVERIDDDRPVPSVGEVVVPGEVVYDAGDRVTRQRWIVRAGTPDELRVTWDASDFVRRVESVAPGAWDKFDAAISNQTIPDEYRRLMRTAKRLIDSAQHVVSDDPDTQGFMQLAVTVGVLTGEQAAQILSGK